MTSFRSQLKQGISAGVKKGLRSFLWITRIVIPVSLLVALLNWTGWLHYLDFLLNPLMSLINLPPQAALPIISGMLINLYTVIAIITTLPFTPAQMTLIAIFNMTAHSLILEGIIQHKSGFHIIKASLVRIAMATLLVLIVSQFLGDTRQSIALPADLVTKIPILETLRVWLIDMSKLLLKIFVIIMLIMTALESLKSLGWIEYTLRFSRPLVKVLGLSERTVTMWVAATIFGLLYGGAVITEEAKKANLNKDELERLHIFVGIHHAAVEDPALFGVLGLNAFWLWVPRLLLAIAAVQSYRILRYFAGKLPHRRLA